MKLAGHVEDRLSERSTLSPELLQEAREKLKLIPRDGASSYHWTVRDNGQVLGHLTVRRVGKKETPVLTTFLGPAMRPSGSELSKTTGSLQPTFRREDMRKAASDHKDEKRVFGGLELRIDRPKGFVQEGKDAEGNPWKRVYKVDYGYIPKTEGGDGEDLDVFLGPDEDAPTAFLVTQKKESGAFDEFKLMLGFRSKEDAKRCYLDHIPEKFFSSMQPISVAAIKALTGTPFDFHKTATEHMIRKVSAYLEGEEKISAPRWIKELRKGGDLAEAIRGSTSFRGAFGVGALDALSAPHGVLNPYGVLRPGLSRAPISGATSSALLDPTLTYETKILPTASGVVLDNAGKSLREYVLDRFRGLSDADRRAISVHPNLSSTGLTPKDVEDEAIRFGGWGARSYRDLLHMGDNPGLDLQAMIDPESVAQLSAAVRQPIKDRREAARHVLKNTTLATQAMDAKRKAQAAGEQLSLVGAVGPAVLGIGGDRETPQSIKEKTMSGLRAWVDDHNGQLGFGITPPRPEDVGVQGRAKRSIADMRKSYEEAATTQDKTRYRSPYFEPQLFDSSDGKIKYNPYKRTADDPETVDFAGLRRQMREEEQSRAKADAQARENARKDWKYGRGGGGGKQPPPPPSSPSGGAEPPPPPPPNPWAAETPASSGFDFRQLRNPALGLAGLAGVGALAHTIRKRRQAAAEAEAEAAPAA